MILPASPSFRPAFLALVLLLAAALVPSGQAQAQLGWTQITAAQARLELDPFQFPEQRRIRWYAGETLPAHYERATTNFDPSQRFFHIMLRQRALAAAPMADETDLQATAVEMWNMPNPDRISWGPTGDLMAPLGPTRYQHFLFLGYPCLVFITQVEGSNGDLVRGFFCDPQRTFIDPAVVQATLSGIRIRG